MDISTSKKMTTLKYFVEAYPESITADSWHSLVNEIGSDKEVYGYIAFLHDDGYLKGKVNFNAANEWLGEWDIILESLRVTSQGYEHIQSSQSSGMLRRTR